MNKLFIVLLAVCLVSVQAYVKRDAPAPATEGNFIDIAQTQLKDLGENLKNQFGQVFDTENMKKNIQEFGEKIKKGLSDLQAKSEQAKSEQAKPEPAKKD